MTRFQFLRSLLSRGLSCLIAGVLWAALSQRASAQDVPNLQETLTVGLKPRLPADFAFIRKVVVMVDQKRLPLDLVLGTFEWVRVTKKGKKYKLPYFAEALRIRAARIGIKI